MRDRFLRRQVAWKAATPARQLLTTDTPIASSFVDEERFESLRVEYFRTFGRHRKLILMCGLIGVIISFFINIHSLSLYRTRTSLDIRSLNSDFMGIRSVATTGDNTAAEADTNLQTQIKLLQSDSLLRETSENILQEPHPQFIERDDILSRLGRALHIMNSKPISYSKLVEDAARRVNVKPLGLTRLVEITCDSWNADFSAKFCNTLTSTFEAQDLQTRATEAQKTSAWLTRQVADVRQRAEESQKKLEASVGGNGLMLSQTSTTVGENRLRSLQDELVKAQADRMAKEAQARIALAASPDTLPEVLDNPAHRAYELKLADLRSRIAELVPPLTEENPKVIHLRSQISDAEAGLLATERTSTHRQDNEYAAARHREDLLERAYRTQQATVSSDLQKIAQVSLLRKELESEQSLYQTLLERAKEAGFASALQAATIRVVDEAKRPKTASSPRRGLAGGVGLVLGCIFGIGLALFKERSIQVFRLPGDVERFLHIHELGVIPSAQRPARKLYTSLLSLEMRDTSDVPSKQGEALALTRWNDNFSLAAEAYRNATFSILLWDSSKRSRSYVVSSPSAGEGKTTVTSNLGVALSKSKMRVVLVDGDLRKPKLHNAFGLENNFGMRNILRGELDLEKVPTSVLTKRTALQNLSIIPAGFGTEDIVELLHSPYLGGLLARLSKDFDIILIDTPPTLYMADVRIFAGQSDGAILVFRAGITTREEAGTARDLFEHDGVRLVGTILNDFDPVREGKAGYYHSYYRYQQGLEKNEDFNKVEANL
jgi:succinoglycan biosynthesis transport protein ExoP